MRISKMKYCALVFLAVICYVSANCGCLKCSKHLTVGGYTEPISKCGPVQVIYKDQPGYYGGVLPVKVQAPIPPAHPPLSPPGKDLIYRAVDYTPLVSYYEKPYYNSYDSKVQAPISDLIPALPASPVKGLTACVDRVVLPTPRELDFPKIKGFEETTIIEEIPYGPSGLYKGGPSGLYKGGPSLAAPCDFSGHVGPVVPYPGKFGCESERVVNVYNPGYVDEWKTGKFGCRYKRSLESFGQLSSFLKYEQNFDTVNNDKLYNPNDDCKSRSKRQVPFLQHGYKFMMNMLPDFIQKPIKNTVNSLAYTHPDKKLLKLYNQPIPLTFKERLELQKKKNKEKLKKRLNEYNFKKNYFKKPFVNDYSLEKEAKRFVSDLGGYSSYSDPTRTPKLYPRIPYVYSSLNNPPKNMFEPGNDLFNNYDTEKEKYPWLKELHSSGIINDFQSSEEEQEEIFDTKPQLSGLEKILFLNKLKKLNAIPKGRSKRSLYDQILESSEIVLPFYQMKLEDSEEHQDHYQYHQDKDHIEEIFRKAVRKELKNYNTQKYEEEEDSYVGSPFPKKKIPQSPLFNLIHFPVEIMKNFNDFNKEAFPFVSFFPKMLTDSRRYFRNFGRNFRRNVLHLASDVIGDFDHVDNPNNIFQDMVNPRFKREIYQNELDQEQYEPDYTLVFEETDETENFFPVFNNPVRDRRHIEQSELELEKFEQYEPDYSLIFEESEETQNFPLAYQGRVRKKRYIFKMVDEDEVEKFLREKLGGLVDSFKYSDDVVRSAGPYRQYPKRLSHERPKLRYNDEIVRSTRQYTKEPKVRNQFFGRMMEQSSEENDDTKKIVLEKLKPKILIDNNGKPFLQINGFNRPVLMKKPMQKDVERPHNPFGNIYDFSEEADEEKIDFILGHARDHVENVQTDSRNLQMPIQAIKEKISQLLFETDVMVHMDFDKFDAIYDELIKLQHIKMSVVQDWRRLIMNKNLNNMSFRIALLEKFKQMQYHKDIIFKDVVTLLQEETENIFVTKKLIKILIRLQKLQCIINQFVEYFKNQFHMEFDFEIQDEIKYVEFLSHLNFVTAKTRNDMIEKLRDDRDVTLQSNIILLDKLKKLLMYEDEPDKIRKESSLLWEMKNIEKMLRSTADEMCQRADGGYKIKKELKILFDLLKRYETCHSQQKKLLSRFKGEESEEESEESEELIKMRRKKVVPPPKKLDIEELRKKWQEKIKQRNLLLKNLKRKARKYEMVESDENE